MLARAQQGQAVANVTGSGPGGWYLGSDMRAAYYGGTTLTGTGQAVGLLEFGGYRLSDVNLTFSNAGQSYSVPVNNVLLDGATEDPVGDDGEQVLDIVQAIGMAPGLSQVRVYIGQGIGQGVDDTTIFNEMASENLCKQLSVSWGWWPADPTTDDGIFQEFAAQGQTVFVASGDYGAFNAAISPNFYPSEDNYVTSVGGTHLTTNGAAGTWASETVWNSNGHGSGGGISPDGIPIPSWQAGVATVSNGGSATLRNQPDVAMEGDYDNYLCENYDGCLAVWSGTSFAAPRWAGFMALVNQQAVQAGNAPSGGIGFINSALYTIGAGPNYTSDFHDITSGNNETDNQPVWFSATTGYDLTTGWGSANGQSLIDALAGAQTPGFWIAPSASIVGIAPGASGTSTITINNVDGFTGSVTLAVTSTLPAGVTAVWGTNPTTNSSVLTLSVASSAVDGTTPVTITGTSGSLTQTTTFNLTIHEAYFSLSALPQSLSMGLGASKTSVIGVQDLFGFTGSVNLAVSGLPAGVTAAWSSTSTSTTSVLKLTASSTAAGGTANVTVTGTSGALTATTNLAVTVTAPTFTMSVSQPKVGMGQGGSGTEYVYLSDLYGFTGNVNLTVSNLPTGVTATFSPNPSTGYSMLTLTASSTAPFAEQTVTVTGTSGTITATTTFVVGVYAPTFTLSTPANVSIGQGTTTTSYVSVNPQYGFTGSVTFSASGLPSGVTAVFQPNSTTGSSTIALTASGSAAVGFSTVTITGTSGTQTITTTFSLGVYVPTFSLWGGGSVNIGQGSTATSYIYVNPQYGFTGGVNFTVSGLPDGVTASFSPNPATGYSTLTLSATSSATIGQDNNVIITGTSGTQSATLPLSLGVYAPTFTLSAFDTTVGQGSSTTSYVYIYPQYGFSSSVDLSVSGLPSGVTASLSPSSTTGSSTLTLTASSTASLGQYVVTVTGTSGSLTVTTTFNLAVNAQSFTLSNYQNVFMNEGSTATTYVYLYGQNGFNGNVTLTASGLPSGVTASFSPNPFSTGSSQMTLTASGTAVPGSSTVTITGTSGSLTASTTLALTINSPNFSLSSAPSQISIAQGNSEKSTVTVVPGNAFSGNVQLAISGLPSGVTASWSPNATSSYSVLTLTASGSATAGTTTATITGTSGALTATLPLAVTVRAAAATTSTTLTVAAAGAPVTSTTLGTVVTLTAAVEAGSTALTTGQVKFCDATADTCDDIHRLGSAQLTSAGTAVWRFVPGMGSHSYKAVFTGTLAGGTSVSSEADLKVTASNATTTTITQSGNTGNYTLAATVSGQGLLAPSGTVSFLDSSSGNTLVGTAALGQNKTVLSWLNSQSPAVALGPVSIAVADFNGDGIPDLAVASNNTATVTILLGNGDGTFTATAASPATGNSPWFIATGDFNGDGKADLVTANLGTSTLTVLLGNGDGTFTASSQSPQTGYYPESIAIGDFNGDGVLDLAVANTYSDSVSIFLGKGDGTFKPATSLVTGLYPISITTADFNGDGIPDLAVSNKGDNTVTVLMGNGDGTFTTSSQTPKAGNYALFIAEGDFNGDGKPDLAVANEFGNNLTILLGNGDGTFTPAASPATDGGPATVVVGDFNGDGKADLAVASDTAKTVTILLGNGDGTFTAAPSQVAGNYPFALAAGDFNKDGQVDLVAGNEDGSNVTVLTSQLAQTASATAGGISPLGTGSHLIDGSYSGDSDYKSSVSGTAGLTALPAGPAVSTVTLTPSSVNVLTGQAFSVTIAVSGGSGNPTPTGSVMLTSGNYSAQQMLSGGSSTFTIAAGSLGTGANPLTGAYSGDSNYAAASGTSSVTVNQVAVTAPAPAPVAPGASATATVAFAAASTYSGTVNLTCTLTGSPTGAQSVPSCTLNPTSVTFTGGGSGTIAMTVKTTAASTASLELPSRLKLWGLGGGGAVLAVSLMFGLPSRRRRWISMVLLLCMVGAAGFIGCGGGGGSQSTTSSTNPGTPATTAGNYAFTITGTDTLNAKITTSTSVTVAVQ